MKILRLILAAALFFAACDGQDPVSTPSTPRYDEGEVGTLCDTSCSDRNPQLGSSGG